MPNYRRAYVPGGTFFFTVVTFARRPLFAEPKNRELLGQVFRECMRDWRFELNAIVLLPDHLHAIWTLPQGDTNYSARWSRIKKDFTKRFLSSGGRDRPISAGQRRERRRGVWQRRFWEHTIESEDDFEARFNYIHYNPVKHGFVRSPCEWEPSSFHRWVKMGVYPLNWGGVGRPDPDLEFADIQDSCGEPI